MPALPTLGRVWLLGCGNMGGALLQRWYAAGLRDVTVIDPTPAMVPSGIAAGSTPPDGVGPDVLVIAVKPQLFTAVATPLALRLRSDTLVVTVMAGVGAAAVSAAFGGSAVVRTMPNTPARLGQGITGLFGWRASAAQVAVAEALMAAAGACVWLDREDDFDAVTALSGSGPAYVFAFVEALAAAGIVAGLSPALAATLAQRTVTGAAALLGEPGATPAALRAAVTSPGGTTAAGLDVLQSDLPELLRATVAAAQSRSRALGRLE